MAKKKIKVPKAPKVEEVVESVQESAESEAQEEQQEYDFSSVISTGSTLLDLAISGTATRGGGIPGGIVVSLAGVSSCGKSSLLAEMSASVAIRGGETRFLDTEARINASFAKVFGMEIPEEQMLRTNTVDDMFVDFANWEIKEPDRINLYAVDSLSALSSDVEMSKDGDPYGTRKAKVISSGFRKNARVIKDRNLIIACTNQLRMTMTGKKTSDGGLALGYYSSLSIELTPRFAGGSRIIKKKKNSSGKEIEKQIGTHVVAKVTKSSIDFPFRTAPVVLKFEEGIDDIHANLQYLKDMTKTSKYNAAGTEIFRLEKAIQHIENNDLEDDLRDLVIDLWEEQEAMFRSGRKRKVRR